MKNNNNNRKSKASDIIRRIRAQQAQEGESFQFPEGGDHSIRDMLFGIEVDQEELINHPLYKEGYEDGYQSSQENYRLLTQALSKVYNIRE